MKESNKGLRARCVHCRENANITIERFEEDGQDGKSNESYGNDYNGYICDKCYGRMDKDILDGLLYSYKETGYVPILLKVALKSKINEL